MFFWGTDRKKEFVEEASRKTQECLEKQNDPALADLWKGYSSDTVSLSLKNLAANAPNSILVKLAKHFPVSLKSGADILKKLKPEGPSDRIFIFFIQLFFEEQASLFLPILEEHFYASLPGAQANAIIALSRKQVPEPPSDIELVKGIPSYPLLPVLKELLKHKNPEVRLSSVRALGTQEHQDVIPDLVKALYDSKSQVCKAAAGSLVRIGSAALPSLRRVLEAQDVRVRIAATWAIGKIATWDPEMVPGLLAAIGDSDERLRKSAQFALESMGEKVAGDVMRAMKKNDNDYVTACGCSILGNLNMIESTSFLSDFILHASKEVRSSALYALGKLDPLKYASLFVRALSDPADCVKTAGAQILATFEKKVEEAVAPLLEILRSPDKVLHTDAIKALSRVGQGTSVEIEAFLYGLDEEDTSIKTASIEALARMGEKGKEAVGSLVKIIRENPESPMALVAIEALGKMPSFAQEAIPALLIALVSQNPSIRTQSVNTLVAIGVPSCRGLLKVASEADLETKKEIVRAFAQIGEPAVPFLVRAMEDESQDRRKVASEALGDMGEKTLPVLLEMLNREDFWIRKAAMRAIEKNGKTAVPYLLDAIRSQRPLAISTACFELLKKLRERAISSIILLISDPDPRLSQFAIQMLQKVNPNYQNAIPDLLPLLSHVDPMVKKSAAFCLDKIGRASEEVITTLSHGAEKEEDPETANMFLGIMKRLLAAPSQETINLKIR